MSLCLAAGAVTATLALDAFTLAWSHSIEKVRWEEDWRVDRDRLVIVAARVRGTGAGMEPPPGSALKDGVWHYRPDVPPQAALRLTHSPHAAGYELCLAGRCAPLAHYLPGIENTDVIELEACP